MKVLRLVETFNSFGQVEGYITTARRLYIKANIPHTIDLGIIETERGTNEPANLLFKVEISIYGKTTDKTEC